ncbi:MAG: hypothetical protein M5R42_04565 [Rhodocyclaceae bacterium]|nr:hypothetical protein [Rhodocyclaceae bacterium]
MGNLFGEIHRKVAEGAAEALGQFVVAGDGVFAGRCVTAFEDVREFDLVIVGNLRIHSSPPLAE